MDKRRFQITLKVLNKVKVQFPETREFTEDRLEQECLEENISVEEVIFLFTSLEEKKLAQKNIFYFIALGFKTESI